MLFEAIAVAVDVADVGEGGMFGFATMEDGDIVAGSDEARDDWRPDEVGAAEDEDAHGMDDRGGCGGIALPGSDDVIVHSGRAAGTAALRSIVGGEAWDSRMRWRIGEDSSATASE